MSNSEIIKILYDEEIGENVRELLENLCSSNLEDNDKTLYQLHCLIAEKISTVAWDKFSKFLYNSIPNFLTYFKALHESIFSGLDITVLNIPKNIESISPFCFDNCDNLTDIVFEKGSKLTELSLHAFSHCKNIALVDLSNTQITKLNYQHFCAPLAAKILLPNTVTTLAASSLYAYGEVIFPNINSIADLKLEIDSNALRDRYSNQFRERVKITTKTDSDLITKVESRSPIDLGPKLKNNTNIVVYNIITKI